MKENGSDKEPFWPDQVFKDGLAATAVIITLVGLSVYIPPPFAGMADSLDASYVPKPEWNFLFFYQALKFFPGHLEVVATVGIPLGGFIILILVPFVDTGKERSPAKRPLAMACWAVAVSAFIALTVAGALSKTEGLETAAAPAPSAVTTASVPIVKATSPPAADVQAGRELFQTSGCVACHQIDGKGGSVGPDLSGEGLRGRTREWLAAQLRDPKSHNPASVMPPFAALGDEKIGKLAAYLQSLKAAGAGPSKSAAPAAPAVAGQAPSIQVEPGPHGGPGPRSLYHRERRSWGPSLREILHSLPRAPGYGQGVQFGIRRRPCPCAQSCRSGHIQRRSEGVCSQHRPLHPARIKAGRPRPRPCDASLR